MTPAEEARCPERSHHLTQQMQASTTRLVWTWWLGVAWLTLLLVGLALLER